MDLEYQLFFLLSLPLGNAFLSSLAEGKAVSDVGVYLRNENGDKTTSHGGQSMVAMTSFLYLSQPSTLQSLYILNNFEAEGPLKLFCLLSLASSWPVSSSELMLAQMCLGSPRA